MKTSIPKKEEVNNQWFIVDAKGKTLGRIATEIANKLRGKDKPTFCHHMDCGDFVIVVNCEQVKLTGNKLENKKYYRHSGYPGALKERSAGEMLEKKPEEVVRLAVRGMLPKNKLRKKFMLKLKTYTGAEHPHDAQSPIPLEV